MPSVGDALRECMGKRDIETSASLVAEVELALGNYVEDPISCAAINALIVKYTSEERLKEIDPTVKGFRKVEEQTIEDTLQDIRIPKVDTINKFLIWLSWAELLGYLDTAECRECTTRLIQSTSSARAKGGAFPENLDTLKRLIGDVIEQSTEVENGKHPWLHVLADCADFGSYFGPKGHKEIFNGLLQLGEQKPKLDIRMLVYGPVQAVTFASRFSRESAQARMRDEDFKRYLPDYLRHLRSEDETRREEEKQRRPVRFELWLRYHSDDESEELLTWIQKYVPMKYRRSITGPVLRRLINCAIDKVFINHGTFTERDEDADALLALLWCREKYFEELLLWHGIDLRRKGSKAPAIIMWLGKEKGAYGFLQTAPKDIALQGWIFDAALIPPTQKAREPSKPRGKMLQVFESIFYNVWNGARREREPACFARLWRDSKPRSQSV